MRPPDTTPLLQPHYRAFIAHTSRPVPVLRLGTLASRFWPLGLSPFTSERLVPAVPCNRLHPLHALSTPATTCSVIKASIRYITIKFRASGFDGTWFLNDAASRV